MLSQSNATACDLRAIGEHFPRKDSVAGWWDQYRKVGQWSPTLPPLDLRQTRTGQSALVFETRIGDFASTDNSSWSHLEFGLFVSQRLHRIETGCSPGRDKATRSGDEQEQSRNARERCRIERQRFVQIGANEMCRGCAGYETVTRRFIGRRPSCQRCFLCC